jgi:predicted N-acyltransferase
MDDKDVFQVKVSRKIEEIPRKDWDSVFPAVLESHAFFKTLDESNFEQFSFYYLSIYDHNNIIGVAPCFLMEFSLDLGVKGWVRVLYGFLKKIFPKIFKMKVLFCGLPMGQGRLGIKGDTIKVINTICNSLEEIAAQEKAPMIFFKDFDSTYEERLSVLRKKGFTRMNSLPLTEMPINFNSFDEYIKKLSSATRYDIRRKFRKIEGKIKINLEIKNELNREELEAVHALYRQAVDKHEVNLENVPAEFFSNISKNMPQETRFFLWRDNEKLVSFAFCLVSGGVFMDYYFGMDYAVAYDYNLYIWRFRDMMNWCIENKMKKYNMGQTGYEPKKRLDFEFIPLYLYGRHRNRIVNIFFGILSKFFEPDRFEPTIQNMRRQKLRNKDK